MNSIGGINANSSKEYIKIFSGNRNAKATSAKASGSSDIPTDIMKIIESNPERIPGMCLHGRSDTRKMIEVSDEIKDSFINLARKNFLNGYGMSDGEEQSAMTKQYLLSMPENQRLYASNTLNEIYYQEAKRLQDIAKERIPGWQAGQPFDRSIFADVISSGSIDKKV